MIEEKRAGLSCIVAHYMNIPAVFHEKRVNPVSVTRVRIISIKGKRSS